MMSHVVVSSYFQKYYTHAHANTHMHMHTHIYIYIRGKTKSMVHRIFAVRLASVHSFKFQVLELVW